MTDAGRQIRTNRLLAALPSSALAILQRDLEKVLLPIGLVLEEVGVPIWHIYFLRRGVVSIVLPFDDGSAVEVANVGPEGMVGMSVLLGAETASVRAVVQVPAVAVRIEVDAFRQAVDQEPVLQRILLRYVLAIVGLLALNSACHRTHSIEQRCARWLLSMHDQVHQDSYPLTQNFLGLMLGVGRPSVSIAASKLQRAGLISYVRGQITILDRLGLEAASCDCYRTAQRPFERVVGGDG